MYKLLYLVSFSAALSMLSCGAYAATVEECIKAKTDELTNAGDVDGLLALTADALNIATAAGCCEGDAASDPMCNAGALLDALEGTGTDLEDTDLSGLVETLEGIDLEGTDLEGTDLSSLADMAALVNCFDETGLLLDNEGCECGTVLEAYKGMGEEMAEDVTLYGDCCKDGTTADEFNACVATKDADMVGTPPAAAGGTDTPATDAPPADDAGTADPVTEGDSAGNSAFFSVLTSFGIMTVAVITLF